LSDPAKVWLNGDLVDADHVHVPITDRGFTLGDGLFETMLWTGTDIRFLGDHLTRLEISARMLGLVLPTTLQDIEAGLLALGQTCIQQRAAIRLTLTRGSGPRGLGFSNEHKPRMLASIAPVSPPTSSVSLKTVSICRNVSAPSARFKTLAYIDNIMALQQAQSLGGDEAIMLGTTGHIACASAANLLVRYQGTYLTPPTQDGAMAGIVRGRLLRASLIEEATITPAMLVDCTHACLTNALIGIRAVHAIDDHVLEAELPAFAQDF
jgi:branched-chain amino acid aminotransferase